MNIYKKIAKLTEPKNYNDFLETLDDYSMKIISYILLSNAILFVVGAIFKSIDFILFDFYLFLIFFVIFSIYISFNIDTIGFKKIYKERLKVLKKKLKISKKDKEFDLFLKKYSKDIKSLNLNNKEFIKFLKNYKENEKVLKKAREYKEYKELKEKIKKTEEELDNMKKEIRFYNVD